MAGLDCEDIGFELVSRVDQEISLCGEDGDCESVSTAKRAESDCSDDSD